MMLCMLECYVSDLIAFLLVPRCVLVSGDEMFPAETSVRGRSGVVVTIDVIGTLS